MHSTHHASKRKLLYKYKLIYFSQQCYKILVSPILQIKELRQRKNKYLVHHGQTGDFPGVPMVKTTSFHFRKHEFNPWSRKFHMPHGIAKKKKKKKDTIMVKQLLSVGASFLTQRIWLQSLHCQPIQSVVLISLLISLSLVILT